MDSSPDQAQPGVFAFLKGAPRGAYAPQSAGTPVPRSSTVPRSAPQPQLVDEDDGPVTLPVLTPAAVPTLPASTPDTSKLLGLTSREAAQFHSVHPQRIPMRMSGKQDQVPAVPKSAAKALASNVLRDAEALVQHVGSIADMRSAINIASLADVDPGPGVDDVPYGNNCGSCSKFLALNDPRRDDPEFMDRYVAFDSLKCPAAFPELILEKRKHMDVESVVRRADSPACTKFSFSRERASDDLVSVMDGLARLTRDELEVVAVSMDSLRKAKAVEERFGYRIGSTIPLYVRGRTDLTGKVLGINVGKRQLVLEAVIDGVTRHVLMPIPSARLLD